MLAEKLIRPATQPVVSFFDKRVIGRETKRWLFCALDTIVPRRKQEIDWLKPGGQETTSPCLQKYGRGFIPRGLAALVEMGADHMPEELLRNVGGGSWQGMIVDGQEVAATLPYIPVFPGDAVTNVLHLSQNADGIRKGIVELRSLIGREWEECHDATFENGILDKIERAFFGDGIEPTLRGLKEQITHGHVSDLLPIDLGLFKDEALQSCDDSLGWGQFKLGEEHRQLKQGTHAAGHVFTYTALGYLLLAQLEVQPQDQPFAELAKMTGDIAKSVAGVMDRPEPSNGGMSMSDAIELGKKLALAEARIAELEASQTQKEHHKTREARERREAAEREAQSEE